MKADARRKEIIAVLMGSKQPIAGGKLSEMMGVSRQIIVQDISIIKAMGYDILATHTGYILQKSPQVERVFKVRHAGEQTEEELSCIVELGGIVVDVFVWHKVYGKISADLNIFSKRGIEQFLEGIQSGKSSELMHITDGYHYHTVRADSAHTLDLIEGELRGRGYIVPEV